jgi:hypothetical protein
VLRAHVTHTHFALQLKQSHLRCSHCRKTRPQDQVHTAASLGGFLVAMRFLMDARYPVKHVPCWHTTGHVSPASDARMQHRCRR